MDDIIYYVSEFYGKGIVVQGRMKKLKDYIDVIFKETHTGEEWIKIDLEVDIVYKTATDEEKKEFEISGAADMLGMLVEYVD